MKVSELRQYLLEQGCAENMFAIGSRGAASDAFCLIKQGNDWVVYYTERGNDSPPIFSSQSEQDACEFFARHILSLEHWHLVGFFIREADAVSLADRIAQLGARPVRNDIKHFARMNDPRYRVFVMGKDIFPVRKAIDHIPINQA